MAKNETSSSKMGTIASKAMRTPEKVTRAEVRSLGASVNTQRPDRALPKSPPRKR